MKNIFALLVLSFAASSSFAIPCTDEDISSALQEYINAQPICFSPCEAAKVYRNIYQKGLSLVTENCSTKDPNALFALRELNKALAQTNDAIRVICH
ncbi:hypothetical protein [Bdellovibrio svalbardensis]|uniref:Uncharacterized protein n=1 Tax=Bdellovibrio svalbardensis TaxID=2972972 RepID=A0ABT6DFE3_9BACT|nr:hypothetical protein [Bdellovibrio svalbardensis]MDG0815565.1 hypothetical protein [Bdellovibrio svalbardensis]